MGTVRNRGLGDAVDQWVYETTLKTHPALVESVRELVRMGQSPAMVERYIARRFGDGQMARNVWHIAHYIKRNKLTEGV